MRLASRFDDLGAIRVTGNLVRTGIPKEAESCSQGRCAYDWPED